MHLIDVSILMHFVYIYTLVFAETTLFSFRLEF